MGSGIILSSILVYFAFLFAISWYTGRRASQFTYFLGNKQSAWYLVAFGMLSDSLSGVTFISVPGKVINSQFSYLQIVFGYFLGYFVITHILLPVYYKLNLTSIYTFLKNRINSEAQKTGSVFFILSRLVGAAARLMLTIGVLQIFLFDALGVHFVVSSAIVIGLMLLYTFKGGIRTLVFTDAFQSLFLIVGVVASIIVIVQQLDMDGKSIVSFVTDSEMSKIWVFDFQSDRFFLKSILGGAFVSIAMTGLDQNMMQKNLSCRSLPEAQKNMFWFSVVMVIINILFISLGTLMFSFASQEGITLPLGKNGLLISDHVFPTLALQHLGSVAGLAFILGLTAATFSSADSVLATLTTSFCIDILSIDQRFPDPKHQVIVRKMTHIGFAAVLFLVILGLNAAFAGTPTIDLILFAASLTYGPLLGLFAYGLIVKNRKPYRGSIIGICLLVPVLCYILSVHSVNWLNGYKFGNELLILNGMLTYVALRLFSEKKEIQKEE